VRAGLAGLGVIQMTDYLLAEHVTAGRMVQLLPDWTSDPLPVHVVYPQNRHLSAKVRVFVEWVSEIFANHPYMHVRAVPRPLQPNLRQDQGDSDAAAHDRHPAGTVQ
jgi:LysR family transcriptional regulator for bpeEF and oprC